MGEHRLASLSGGTTARDGVAECSCGWRGEPSWTAALAHRRWEFHVLQEQAQHRCDRALELRARFTQRRRELHRTRDLVAAQRRTVAAQREGARVSIRPAWLTLAGAARAAELDSARAFLDLSVGELWLDYVAVGGNADVGELQQMLGGSVAMTRLDRDRLGVVLNERFSAAGYGRPLPYWAGAR